MIYTIKNYSNTESTLEYVKEIDRFLEQCDNNPNMLEESGVLERFIDNLKLAFSKDKKTILDKYKKYIDEVKEYDEEIRSLEGAYDKSKIKIEFIYEYYEVTCANGNGGYTIIKYMRDARFIYDIININSEFNKISKMSDKASKKKYLKKIHSKYDNDLLYNRYGVETEKLKGTIYDIAKKANDRIKYFKEISDEFVKVIDNIYKSIDEASDLLDTIKQENNENAKYLKNLLKLQKSIGTKDYRYLLACEVAASKQSKVLRKYINKVKSKVGVE